MTKVSPGRSLRAAIVGAGFIGQVHAEAVRSVGGVVAGVADATAEKAAALQARSGAAQATTSADELIVDTEVDVVHICTPNYTHVELAERALRAGKHVVCEKPLATTSRDAIRLAELARSSGLVAAVPFVYRYYPTVREARERVLRGDLGTLTVLHGSYLQDWLALGSDTDWRVSSTLGGASRAFADIGVHWVDLVEFVTGQRLACLSARLLVIHPERPGPTGPAKVSTEDAAVVSFETDGGAVGSVVVSQVSHGRKNRLWFSLDGTKESVVFDHDLAEWLWVGGRAANQLLARSPEALGPAAARLITLPPGHPQGWHACFDAFVADVYCAIAGEKPPGLPVFDDGARGAVVTEAVLRAAEGGAWVEVQR